MPVHACYHQIMLTRSQVAKRIGRSIATVRKMEGRTLHPRVDARGVHRFDVVEVEAVARRIAETGRALDARFPWTIAAPTSARRPISGAARIRRAETPRKRVSTDAESELLALLADLLKQ